MKTANPNGNGVHSREVVGGVKVIESEYRVKVPVFEDVPVERAVFVDKKVEIPSGVEEYIEELGNKIADSIIDKCMKKIDSKLEAAINERIKEVQVPEIIYNKVYKDVEVERPVYKDVDIDRVTYTDKEIINPIMLDKTIINPVMKDVEVTNAILKDKVVPNVVFEEVVVLKPKIVEREVNAIHIRYVDPQGNPIDEKGNPR